MPRSARRCDGDMGKTKTRRLVAAVVAVQIAVPALAMVLCDAPTRFGFQMYSGVGSLPEITADGAAVPIDSLIAAPRAEIDWSRVLPEHTCRQFPKAKRIAFVAPHDRVRRELSC